MLEKIAYPELVAAAATLGVSLPPTYDEKDMQVEEFLKAVHQAIQEVDLIEGRLVCPACERCFPVANGIPNMLLHDDEV